MKEEVIPTSRAPILNKEAQAYYPVMYRIKVKEQRSNEITESIER
jgi:hypothetical protein